MESDLDNLTALNDFLEDLPERLEKTPYDHSIYIQWLSLIRLAGDIDSLRQAREHMYVHLAVPEAMFMEWIADEEAQPDALSNTLALQKIVDLFDMAVKERASPLMWQAYIDFVARVASSEDISVRAAAGCVLGSDDYLHLVLQRAVDAMGAHYTQSQALWVQYKEHVMHKAGHASDSQRQELADQLQAVFLARLRQPHAELEDTFAMYSEFTTQYHGDEYEQQMVGANKIVSHTRGQCAQRVALEARLTASDESWSGFSAYISSLTRSKETSTDEIAMLYERALLAHCYVPDVWDEYIAFMAGDARGALDASATANRAIRNCPWSGKLWAQVVYLEYSVQDYDHATAVYSRALSTNAVSYSMAEYGRVATAWIGITRLDKQPDTASGAATLLAACHSCMELAYSLDKDTADPCLFFERCCTSTAAVAIGGVEEARKMWGRCCTERKLCAEAWILFAEFERVHGAAFEVRSVFRRAAQRILDYPDRLFDAWLAFENTAGDIASILAAERTINAQRHFIQRRAERAVQQAEAVETSAPLDSAANEHMPPTRPAKHQRTPSDDMAARDASNEAHGAGDDTSPDGPLHKKPKHAHKDPGSNATAVNSTVFVQGLPESYSAAEVTALLGSPADISEVTLATNKQGVFCGQAKVAFSSTDGLIAALDMNGTKVEGRFISVHIYKDRPSARKKQAEICVKVQGFSPETGNKKIRAIAEDAGAVVRMHRNQAGDVAFIAMESRAAALQAVDMINGREIDGQVVSAVLPQSKDDARPPAKKHTAPSGLVPRKAARRPAKKAGFSTRPPQGVEEQGVTKDMVEDQAQKNNADFREMYLSSR
ncbi:Splicing factor [Coemansia sp. RSA 552]|nr:Splicing factor [Coemansia sp. RSA 552]